ncbi:hypothetical protein RIR_jg7418.t1 [Rhizophagus irregularis DAOM 181602=DAOM 197198]|nr:hypothetical protein RIR_jg7418.t1 [Rhizophagus irregularis DAOM 181602=DAOM 197198]
MKHQESKEKENRNRIDRMTLFNHRSESTGNFIKNEEQDHGQDDQIFVQPKKNDKKRTKIDTSMRKRAKPDEKILLAINKIRVL